jgi:Superinfection immunity protein
MTLAASGAADPGNVIGVILFVIVGVVVAFLYWLPTFIGWQRHVPNLGSIGVINGLLGWTVFGWAAAMAMAARSVPPGAAPPGVPEPWRGQSRGPDGRLP